LYIYYCNIPIESHNTSLKAPGPGQYPLLETISPKGKIFISKYKSAATTVFSPASSDRFAKKEDGNKFFYFELKDKR